MDKKFNVGDVVICIDNTDVQHLLKFNEYYIVKDVIDMIVKGYMVLISYEGGESVFDSNRFMLNIPIYI